MEAYGWHSAIQRLFEGKGTRWISDNAYEAFISCHSKFMSCGTWPTKELAQKAVVITKIKILEASILAHGDDPASIVESVEEGYFVSPNGNVYNRHGDLMKGAIDHCGYRHIITNRKNRNVHRIIAETFIPNPDGLPCVNHKDGNKQNNAVENLEWTTHSENTLHSYRAGLQKSNGRGEVKKYVNQN